MARSRENRALPKVGCALRAAAGQSRSKTESPLRLLRPTRHRRACSSACGMPASNTPSHVPDRHHPILVTDGQQVLSVSIHAGMSTDLISRSIIEGFDLGGHEVLGLRAPAEGTIFPLSLVARAPSFFSRAATREPTTFGLVLEAPAQICSQSR